MVEVFYNETRKTKKINGTLKTQIPPSNIDGRNKTDEHVEAQKYQQMEK